MHARQAIHARFVRVFSRSRAKGAFSEKFLPIRTKKDLLSQASLFVGHPTFTSKCPKKSHLVYDKPAVQRKRTALSISEEY